MNTAQHDIKGVLINVCGRATERVPQLLELYPAYDFYVCVETMWEEGGWGSLNLDEFLVHHCTRAYNGHGRVSGGILVLLRANSPLFHSGVRVQLDPLSGIAWVHLEKHLLTLAFIYFSPFSSALYNKGVLNRNCINTFIDGLAAARSRGHKLICMGDFNIRTGCMDEDAAGLGIDLGPDLHLGFGGPQPGVPTQRVSSDTRVPDRTSALSFLLGLNANDCVVLNGRWPGDMPGKSTCVHVDHSPHMGSSVVDYAIVSASLYGSVQNFTVQPLDPALSHDHCALCMHLSLHLTRPLSPSGQRVPRSHRPRGEHQIDLYISELQRFSTQFESLLRDMEQGYIPLQLALTKMTEILRHCAKLACSEDGPARRAPGQHAPWFDAECCRKRDALRHAWQAWFFCCPGCSTKSMLRDDMLAARRAYKSIQQTCRMQFEREQQIKLIDAYFSDAQRDFWRVFNRGRAPSCPQSDIAAWTTHFVALLGQQPSPLQLTSAQQHIKNSLMASTAVHPSSMSILNAPVTLNEVADVMQSLPPSKASDCQGLTCELLKYPATEVHQATSQADTSQSESEVTCPALIECVTFVVQTLLSQHGPGALTCLPDIMQAATLAPVPKPLARHDPLNPNLYRGIAVGSIFKRVLTRVMKNRADACIERLGLRAPTQCGFRVGHGCLDALFTLQHLINSARASNSLLWVVFVDFKKAFDCVRRDLLLERCQNLGIHGPFLQALCMLYDKVLIQVKVNGHVGDTFETFVGTEQGSELSPLLFGVFMDLLYELIKLQVPGAGPVLGNINVSNLMYADDVNLISRDPTLMQQLLECLSLFCYIFGMEVNLDPHKTCCVVFRKPGTALPATFQTGHRTLTYRGQPIVIKQCYTYLGMWLHETKSSVVCADVLADKGRNAMHALVSRLRQHNISQFDMRCRMFDVLVEPVLSYGAQVWGAHMLSKWLFKRGGAACAADSVHHQFLCSTVGVAAVGKNRDVLLREFHRISLPYRWALLVTSWWEKLKGMHNTRIAHQAWLADIELMLSGCSDCWTFHFLHALQGLDVINANQWHPSTAGITRDDIVSLDITRATVHTALMATLHRRWSVLHGNSVDPRRGGPGVQLRTHMFWVHKLADGVVVSRHTAPKYMKLCLPMKQLQCLARYRLGGSHLEGRKNHSIAVMHRFCPLCSSSRHTHHPRWRARILARCGSQQPEDLMHFMLHCPAYDHIREKYSVMFSLPTSAAPVDRLHDVFNNPDQATLVRCVWHMDLYRSFLMGLRYPSGARIMHQPFDYVPADVTLRCSADFGLQSRLAHLWQIAVLGVLILLYALICQYNMLC